ncbi:transcriptional regulatory protein AlgP-like isoform X2 [Antechinus flavipes]|uniref:transcriptional regulatory protein AlgP-like isoform X2 n=1 Tax=Antechinus flavipes TaxID=38775 RepID=UPI002236343F|nr:transcriptional regulatory protein AlgP-like isoform X2 [Antechinus flavipes]
MPRPDAEKPEEQEAVPLWQPPMRKRSIQVRLQPAILPVIRAQPWKITEPAGRPGRHPESRSPPAAPGGTPSHGASRPPQAALRVTEPAGRPGRYPESRSQPAAPGSTPSHGASRPPRAAPRVTEPAGRPRQHSESLSLPAAPGSTLSHGASRPPRAAP